jgi:sec-independent protein translocase protein TatC
LAFALCYLGSGKVLSWLNAPLFSVLPEGQRHLFYNSVFESFMAHMNVSCYAAILGSVPYWLVEIWGFVSPGLSITERRIAARFSAACIMCTIAGAAFGYFIFLPFAVKSFVKSGPTSGVPLITMARYYSDCLLILVASAVAFQLPVLVVGLVRSGLVSAEQFRARRSQAYVAIAIGAAIVTPPDAVSMLLMAVPLVLLYEAGIVCVSYPKRSLSRAANCGNRACSGDLPVSGRK